MYVCICQGITERQIHDAARNGIGCLRDLRQQLGVTEGCGRCAVCAHACLKEAHHHVAEEVLKITIT